MSVINPAATFRPLAIVVLIALFSACQAPEPVPDNRYQRTIENTSSVNTASASQVPSTSQPVIQLQNQALAAINEDQYPLAIDYLQRAIKIEPRNAWSWYYLADIYWRTGQYQRCLAMIERSTDYTAGDDDQLAGANTELQGQCQ
jgi:tetratricopeptide (TPR) repeat protein